MFISILAFNMFAAGVVNLSPEVLPQQKSIDSG